MDETSDTKTETAGAEVGGLHRSANKRLIAGVAGGIGERFDVDPNIVRVVFVVLTYFWGLGAAIYLAMWALVRRSDANGGASGENAVLAVSTSRWLYYALAAGLIGLAVIVVSTFAGVPRFAGGLVVLWLIFLFVLAIVALRAPARRLSLRRAIATLFLAFVSLIIVVSGVLLGFLGSTGIPVAGGNGVRIWQPTSLAQLQHTYRTEFGSSTVDLSNVIFPTNGYSLTSTVSVGNLLVVLPADAVVDLKTHLGIGSVSYQLVRGSEILNQFEAVPSSLRTAANRAKAPHLTIDAEVGIGHILIRRAAPNPAP